MNEIIDVTELTRYDTVSLIPPHPAPMTNPDQHDAAEDDDHVVIGDDTDLDADWCWIEMPPPPSYSEMCA